MSPIIEATKKEAKRFVEKTLSDLEAAKKKVDEFRIKVIYFGDYWADGTDAMLESEFYSLPDQMDGYSSFLEAPLVGGGDAPESALEAIALGMKSNWTSKGEKRRHIVVMYTDAPPHPLEKGDKPSHYPSDMPGNLSDLAELWSSQATGLSKSSKRMFLFAPESETWNAIYENFDNAIHVAAKAGAGLADMSIDDIVDQIVKSI